jgi:type III secretion protein W
MAEINTQILNLKKAELAIIRREDMAQVAAANSLKSAADNAMFSRSVIHKNFDSLLNRTNKKGEAKESKETEAKEKVILEVNAAENIAEEFEEKNPELQAKTLLALRSNLSSKDSLNQLLQKVRDAYPDCSLADEALDFLIKTSDPELAKKLIEVKKQFNETHGKEITAGKNIAAQAREFSKADIGSPTALRDLYRDITQNPRPTAALFEELTESYAFDKLKTVLGFLFHSIGSDLKSKGPSIAKGELFNLLKEAKDLQALLSVYRFFRSRMQLITSSYEREGLLLPPRVTFESLSKLFVKFLLERYPSGDKVYQIGMQLGIEDEYIAEAIIFLQMRDAVRYVSPRLFKSEQHRQDILAVLIDTLKEIEDKEEEEDDDDEDENYDDI